MNFQIVGCSHHTSSLQLREQLAFSPDDTRRALRQLKPFYYQRAIVLNSIPGPPMTVPDPRLGM